MKINLIAATEPFNKSDVEFIAYCAKTCYDRSDKINDEKANLNLVKSLLESKHFSVFEHISLTFEVSCVSRAFTHQLVRHRHLSYTQVSQRYTIADGYIRPKLKSEDAKKIFNNTLKTLQSNYEKLLELGEKPEDARYILPQGAATKIIVSGNLRAWMEMIDLRLKDKSMPEFKSFAKEVGRQILDRYGFLIWWK